MHVMKKGTITAVFAAAFVAVTAAGYSEQAWSAYPVAAAARTGDYGLSRELISSGADVNLPEPDGTTPLLWAVYNSNTDLMQLLLEAGADPNVANGLHISPLLQASRYGDADMIKALIAHGANPANTEPGVEPLLMAAARSGSVPAVQLLLAEGANPNQAEPLENQTALMWAIAEGHIDVAKVLLKAGADPNLQARVSELTLRKNADFPSGGFAPLHWATRNGDEAAISLLLDNNADINVRNGDGSTPMMLAIVNDRFDIAASLLAHKADPNDGSLYFVTEMHDATTDWRARDGTVFRADHPNRLSALDLTRLLLEAGANPNQPYQGQMHSASMCCDTKADATPFYRAAVASDVEALKLMLAYGADTSWSPAPPKPKGTEDEMAEPKGNVGKTPLMVAIVGGKGVGIAGGPNDLRQGLPEFREPASRVPFEAVTVLLEAGAEVNVADPKGDTPLHIAANAGQLDIVRALVARGASLEAKNKAGQTPLQLVKDTPPAEGTPGFFFLEPPASQAQIIAALTEMAGGASQ